MVEFVEEERDFQIQLHGGKSTKPSQDIKSRARTKLKDPRKLKRKK